MANRAGLQRVVDRRADRAAAAAVWLAVAPVVAVFAWLLGDVIWHALAHLSPEFLFSAPRDAGRAGGIAPILASTGLILLVCLAAVVPLALVTAIWLAEFGRRDPRVSRALRVSLDVLAGMPSIVFGLFGHAFFVVTLGLGLSILAGGLTLACMALPLVIRATEEGLRAVPDGYRRGAAALGLSRRATILSILLPAAVPGLVVGLILGIGRALAETAALIFTSGYVDRWPGSLLDSGRALSLHIYDLSMNVPGGEGAAYASALVLVGLLVGINLLAIGLSRGWMRRRAMEVN